MREIGVAGMCQRVVWWVCEREFCCRYVEGRHIRWAYYQETGT